MLWFRSVAFACVTAAFLGATPAASASLVDDVFAEYSLMHINRVKVGGQEKAPTFLRHNLELAIGLDDFSLGVIYQRTDKSQATMPGIPADGLMLTVGYYRILTTFLSLDAYARAGITEDNRSQPLYATDSDIRLKLVLFDPKGWGALVKSRSYPSLYLGTIVNQYGRIQGLAGAGVWWRGVGAYFTGYYAFNGVEDPFDPGDAARERFAALKNAGVTMSLSYELQLKDIGDVRVEVRQNVPLANAGNELRVSIGYRYAWKEQVREPWGAE